MNNHEMKELLREAIKEELTPFKEEVKTMFSALKEGQEKTHAELIAFKDEIHERFDHQDRRFRLLDADLDGLNAQIQKNTRDIESTKKQIGNQ